MTPPARTALLGEVCDINPRLPKAHGLQDDCEVGFVPMAAVNEASGTIEQRLTRRFAEVKKGYTPFAEDDVLFAKITPCMENGKAAIARGLAGGRGFGSTEFHVLRARESVLPEWLYYFVRQRRFRREARRSFTGTTGQQRVPAAFMAGAAIPVPELAEQRRMIDVLSRAESIVRLRREARRKTEQLILAIHADMFGDAAANPRGWPVATLGDALERIDSGKSPRCHDRPKAPDEWGVLRLSALKDAAYNESEHKTLPDKEVPDARCEVRRGDLLLSRKNTLELVGTPAYVWETQGRLLLPDLIFRLCPRPESGAHPLYLWALLMAPAMRRRLRLMASGTAASMLNISKERLRTLPIMVPPLAHQQAFADHATALHSISLQQQAALANAEATFEALLARAFKPQSSRL